MLKVIRSKEARWEASKQLLPSDTVVKDQDGDKDYNDNSSHLYQLDLDCNISSRLGPGGETRMTGLVKLHKDGQARRIVVPELHLVQVHRGYIWKWKVKQTLVVQLFWNFTLFGKGAINTILVAQ